MGKGGRRGGKPKKAAERAAAADRAVHGGIDHGTPETRAKLRRDGIRELEARSPLWRPEYRTAADEIREVYLAIVASVLSRAQTFERVDGGNGAHRWATAMLEHYHDRYKPWADELSAVHALNGPPLLEVVIDAVVDGETVSSIAARRRHRSGRVTEWIIDGLSRYCRISRGRRSRAA